jgi:hypothetical protein
MMSNLRKMTVLGLLVLFAVVPVAASEGYLYIESDPPGARVVIDGFNERVLETPTLCTLAVGPYQVTLFQTHYEPRTVTVTIKPNWVERRNVVFVDPSDPRPEPEPLITLSRQMGELTILTDVAGGSVWLDERLIDVPAPVTIKEISAGEHRVTLEIRGMTYDTTIMIPVQQTLVLSLPMAELVARAGMVVEGGAVPVSLAVDLPGCRYLRADERTGLRSNITILGVDAKLRIVAGDSTVELSHQNLATRNIGVDSRGNVIKKRVPDTTISCSLKVSRADNIDIAVITYTWDGDRYIARDRITPRRKTCTIPGDFNSGQAINIRVIIDKSGDIVFKYW